MGQKGSKCEACGKDRKGQTGWRAIRCMTAKEGRYGHRTWQGSLCPDCYSTSGIDELPSDAEGTRYWTECPGHPNTLIARGE